MTKSKSSNKYLSIAITAAVVLAVISLLWLTLHRNGDSLTNTHQTGEEIEYHYIPEEEIVTQKLIGEEFEYGNVGEISGKFSYKINSITAYDNVYELCGEGLKDDVKNGILIPSRYGLHRDFSACVFYEDGTNSKAVRYPTYFDNDTGKMLYDFYMFVFEIEITNINAKSTRYNNKPYLFNLSGLFGLVNRSGETPYYGELSYFKEVVDEDDDGYFGYKCEINPGETKTIHFGYFLYQDNSERPFSRIGMTKDVSAANLDDTDVFYWFDMSDIIDKMKKDTRGASN